MLVTVSHYKCKVKHSCTQGQLTAKVNWSKWSIFEFLDSMPVLDIYKYNEDRIKRWPLRKHAFSNILKILQPKKEKLQIKKSDIFHISAQNIDCGYSLELPRF